MEANSQRSTTWIFPSYSYPLICFLFVSTNVVLFFIQVAGNHWVLILKEIWIYLLKSTTEAWQWARNRMTCLYSYLFKNMLRPLCHNLVSSYDHKTTKKMTIQNDSSIITVVKLIHKYYFYQKRQILCISIAWIMTHGSRLIWLSNPLPLINMRCFLWPQYILLKTPCLLRWSISSQTSGGCGVGT